uniref:Uncharacterized protein n=1 Tax=Arundo donax TaxID=35708 RepID=A0A0A9HEF2_ARUDO
MLADLTTRTRRLIAEMSKEEHSVFPACLLRCGNPPICYPVPRIESSTSSW